jgi:hypothetical protein
MISIIALARLDSPDGHVLTGFPWRAGRSSGDEQNDLGDFLPISFPRHGNDGGSAACGQMCGRIVHEVASFRRDALSMAWLNIGTAHFEMAPSCRVHLWHSRVDSLRVGKEKHD